jgi:hypothetical protein
LISRLLKKAGQPFFNSLLRLPITTSLLTVAV